MQSNKQKSLKYISLLNSICAFLGEKSVGELNNEKKKNKGSIFLKKAITFFSEFVFKYIT